jgi:hypothetical protein
MRHEIWTTVLSLDSIDPHKYKRLDNQITIGNQAITSYTQFPNVPCFGSKLKFFVQQPGAYGTIAFRGGYGGWNGFAYGNLGLDLVPGGVNVGAAQSRVITLEGDQVAPNVIPVWNPTQTSSLSIVAVSERE